MRNRYAFPLTNYKNNYSTAATKLSRGTNIDLVLIYSLWFQKSKLNWIQELWVKMFCSDKWIWTLANFFCILPFLVQLFDLLPSYFAPPMTNTQISNEQVKNIEFPLDIQICVNRLLNTKALQEFGFSKVTFYQIFPMARLAGVGSITKQVQWQAPRRCSKW